MEPTKEEKKMVNINFQNNEVILTIPNGLDKKYPNYFKNDVEKMIINSQGMIIDFSDITNLELENKQYKWKIK